MKIFSYIKFLWAKYVTKNITHVEYLAMPITGLEYSFMFRINSGKWQTGTITVQEQYVNGGKAAAQIHFDKLIAPYWGEPQVQGYAYFTVLRGKKQVVKAMNEITKQYSAEF